MSIDAPESSQSSNFNSPPANQDDLESGDVVEEKDLQRFEKAQEFLAVLHQLFPTQGHDGSSRNSIVTEGLSPEARMKAMATLEVILHDYQEQSYLLDPFLDQMVGPPIAVLQSSTRRAASQPVSTELASSGEEDQVVPATHLLYLYTKVRGYKTIIRYFPHQVSDVVPTLRALLPCLKGEGCSGSSAVLQSWHLRYILLLWLSLICMIPFDLSKFDGQSQAAGQSKTCDEVVGICQHFLSSSGKERDAAAITLGKLFQRRDASKTHLPPFIRWCKSQLSSTSPPNALLATGILHTLCEVLKTSTSELVVPHLPDIQTILSMGDHGTEDSDALRHLRSNRLVNKFRSKLAARMGLKILKPRNNGRGITRKQLGGGTGQDQHAPEGTDDEVSEDIDAYIAQLLNGLQDNDTVVRYSAAKGLARICERLPGHFIDQVTEAITQLFSINVLALPGKDHDYSAVSEHTWQGACLALAELARRGLLNRLDMQEQLEWARRGLFLDVRRGSHSVGAAVRDAACYFFWALARAYDAESLRSHGESLAQSLATLSLLDREISIRRAASAAYQECVGRLGIFPHGIEIIGKTDFFSIGVRRNAFLQCMPAVAKHKEYRDFVLRHLVQRTIVHWDPAMRILGSQAIARVIKLDMGSLCPQIIDDLAPQCKSRDIFTLHGALLTLSEVASLCDEHCGAVGLESRLRIFNILDHVPRQTLQSLGMGQVIEAACLVIANSVSEASLEQSPKVQPAWEAFIEAAMKRKEESIHRAAAEALRAVSQICACRDRIEKGIIGWRSFTESQQQSFALVLGSMRPQGPDTVEQVLRFLLSLLRKPSPTYAARIETRRNAINSSVAILLACDQHSLQRLPPNLIRDSWNALLEGLEDYTTDQRGDVGSWIRLACLQRARQLLDSYSDQGFSHALANEWLPESLYQDVIAGIAKQMTERIDNVRAEAAHHFIHLCTQPTGRYQPEQVSLIRRVFELDETNTPPTWDQLRDPSYLFPRTAQLMLIPRYRPAILRGIVQSIGTKTELSQRIVSQALLDFAMDNHAAFSAKDLLESLVLSATDNFASSKIVTPYFQSIQHMLESDVLSVIMEDEGGLPLMRKVLTLAARSLDKIKTPQRLTVTMNVIVDLLGVEDEQLRRDAVALFPVFLGHTFPTLRAAAAEKVFVVASDHIEVPEVVEELLLGQTWSDSRPDNFGNEAQQVAKHLLEAL